MDARGFISLNLLKAFHGDLTIKALCARDWIIKVFVLNKFSKTIFIKVYQTCFQVYKKISYL